MMCVCASPADDNIPSLKGFKSPLTSRTNCRINRLFFFSFLDARLIEEESTAWGMSPLRRQVSAVQTLYSH